MAGPAFSARPLPFFLGQILRGVWGAAPPGGVWGAAPPTDLSAAARTDGTGSFARRFPANAPAPLWYTDQNPITAYP